MLFVVENIMKLVICLSLFVAINASVISKYM